MEIVKRIPKRVRWLLVLTVVSLLIVGVVRHVSAPVHGRNVAVDVKLQPKRQTTATPPATTVQADYFQLDLPTGYKPQAAQTVPGLLYAQTLVKPSTMGSLLINIGIKNLPEGGLSGDSSYRLREQSARYRLSSQTVHGETVQIANDAESAAVVAFWPHGGYLATISISSGLGNPAADDNATELAALQPLLKAWQWR